MSLKFELDHIGVAVASLNEGRGFYEALGLGPMTSEFVAGEKVNVGFFPLENGPRIELLEATDESGTIAKYLKKRGPGIHHICLRVNDIHQALEKLKVEGVTLINDKPTTGAHDCLVAFIHPKSTGGVLIELSQSRSPSGPRSVSEAK